MYINHAERTIILKICVYGPALSGKMALLKAMYHHFAATDGEGAKYDVFAFGPRSGESAEFIANAERSFGAPYDELADGGTVIWMRARHERRTGESDFDLVTDALTVSGNASGSALRKFTLQNADAVLFVADPRPERYDATLEACENLAESEWAGPVVLYAEGDAGPRMAKLLGHDGAVAEEGEGLDAMLAAFRAAMKAGLDASRAAAAGRPS